MTLERGSRDDTTARSPVSARFVLSSPLLLSSAKCLGLTLRRAFSSSFSFFFFSSFRPRRRQVGIRAAVNSPAPLSALMSLLLFALLNAIRAYFVSLSLRPVPLDPALPRRFLDFSPRSRGSSRTRIGVLARATARKSSDSSGRYTNTHATRA